MKATLEFTLPEESTDHLLALQGSSWSLLAWNIDQWARNEVKFNDRLDTATLEELRDQISQEMSDWGLSFDD